MNCMTNIVKYILYLFNIIFVICGILLIVFGSIVLSKMGNATSFQDAIDTRTIPILILVLGCIVFLVSFFGCCGAIRENVCCLTTYAICMFILFALQIALVVYMFVQRDQFLSAMGDIVDKAWDENTSAQGFPMDGLQLAFKCCGKTSYRDYTDGNNNVPTSCCGTGPTCEPAVYESRPGCKATFVDFWASNTNIIRYAGIGVALIELLAFTFACCVANGVRRSRSNY